MKTISIYRKGKFEKVEYTDVYSFNETKSILYLNSIY